MVESLLDQVPGLGEVRRKALITYFGSLKKLRAATRRGDRGRARLRPKTGLGDQGGPGVDARRRREAVNMATGE